MAGTPSHRKDLSDGELSDNGEKINLDTSELIYGGYASRIDLTYEKKRRTAAPAFPHETPNQKGVIFTAKPNPFDRPIKNDLLQIFKPTCLLQRHQISHNGNCKSGIISTWSKNRPLSASGSKGCVTPNFETLLRDYAHPSFIHLGRFEIDDMTEGTVQYGGTEVVGSERTVRYDGLLHLLCNFHK